MRLPLAFRWQTACSSAFPRRRNGRATHRKKSSRPSCLPLPLGLISRHRGRKPEARVAQLVEQRTENPRVGGSNPPPGTTTPPAIIRVLRPLISSSAIRSREPPPADVGRLRHDGERFSRPRHGEDRTLAPRGCSPPAFSPYRPRPHAATGPPSAQERPLSLPLSAQPGLRADRSTASARRNSRAAPGPR